MDVIDQLVGDLRQQSSVFCRVEASDPWRIRKPACPAPSFYAVISGALRVMNDGILYDLSAGDFLVLPHGRPHEIMGQQSEHAEPRWLYNVFAAAGIERWKPGMRYRTDRLKYGTGVPGCVFLGGLFYFGEPRKNPLLVALPDALLVRRETEANVQALINGIAAELDRDQPGSSMMIAKSADLLFVQALRTYLRQEPRGSEGWIRGIGDSSIGNAFASMHAAPERRWTLQLLAKEAGCSRAMFAKRFRQLVGRGALSYLTEWRMHLAAGFLLQGDMDVASVAARVGYRPEAFASAFKRWSGISPRNYRSRVAG